MANEITILSVYHSKESRELLKINAELTRKLNPGVDFEWILADNTPANFPEKIRDYFGEACFCALL